MTAPFHQGAVISHFAGGADDLADQPIFHGFFGAHPEIALGVGDHLFIRLAGLHRDLLDQAGAHLDDFLGLDGDVRSLTLHAAQGLVQQETGEWQAEAVFLFAPRKICAPADATQPVPIIFTREPTKRSMSWMVSPDSHDRPEN